MSMSYAVEGERPLLPTNGRGIIIPVMGATGAGKSYFINALLKETGQKEAVKVGLELSSCTVDLLPVEVKGLTSRYEAFKDEELIIVDTPGFDDTKVSDFEILKRIADWLKKSCQAGAILGGVIYLHDISQDRFSGTTRKNLEMFHHLCGDDALRKVVFVTSKWGRQGGRDFEARENELRTKHWHRVVGGPDKARIMRFDDEKGGNNGAVRIVQNILAQARGLNLLTEVLQIQNELVNRRRVLPQTRAAKALREQLEDLIKAQAEMLKIEAKAAEGDEEAKKQLRAEEQKLQHLASDVKALKLTLRQRLFGKFTFLRLFGQ